MKYACPYCHADLGGKPRTQCPRCSRVMVLPDKLLPRPARERIRARDRFRKSIARKNRRSVTTSWLLGTRPLRIILGVFFLGAVGAILLIPKRENAPGRGLTSDEQRAHDEAVILRVAVELFRRDCGRYPTLAEGIPSLELDRGVPGWKGPYVTLLKPDPWRMPYGYRLESGNATVFSCGPDTAPHTDDDILPSGWERHPRLQPGP